MAASQASSLQPRALRAFATLVAPLATCALLAVGCGEQQTLAVRQAPARQEAPLLHGRIVARASTTLRAPQNVFRVGGWHSTSSFTHLIDVAAEGQAVTKDEVVARFRFRHQRAKSWIDTKVRRADAAAEKRALQTAQRTQELLADQRTRAIFADRARINTLKAPAISKRQLRLYEIDHQIASFEIEAINLRITAYRREAAAVTAFHRQARSRARAEVARYHRYKERYVLRAPHAGVVRYAYNRRRRRKIRKGDGMKAGMAVLSIARDARIAVRFFVPEHRLSELHAGDPVDVLSLTGDTAHAARVERIERFPQEIGFLREDSRLPNAREKAFVVRAEFERTATDLTAGNEVRVRVRTRAAADGGGA